MDKNGLPIGTPVISSIEDHKGGKVVKYNYDVLYPDSKLKNEVLFDYEESDNVQSAAKKVTYDWRDKTDTQIAIGYIKADGKEHAQRVLNF